MILGAMTTIPSFVWHRDGVNLFANARGANLCCFSCEIFVLFYADIYDPVSLKFYLIIRFKWAYKCKEKYNRNCNYHVIPQGIPSEMCFL